MVARPVSFSDVSRDRFHSGAPYIFWLYAGTYTLGIVMSFVRSVAFLALGLVCFTGCGNSYNRPKLVKVSGTITLDGQPLAEASVVLEPAVMGKDKGSYNRSSNAVTDAEGKFQMTTYGENDGLPVGKYKVAVVKQTRKNPPGMDPEMATPEQLAKVVVKDIVPVKYNSMTTSGLEVEVTASGLQPATIALQSK